MTIKDVETGNNIYISINKDNDGNIAFYMGYCNYIISVEDTKSLIEELRKEILK